MNNKDKITGTSDRRFLGERDLQADCRVAQSATVRPTDKAQLLGLMWDVVS